MDIDELGAGKIHAVHRAHAMNQEVFRLTADSPETIKANRRLAQTQCTTCNTARQKLQTCQRCKSVWYCSRECQKKDWPRHKMGCTSEERPKGMKKLVERLVCNMTIIKMFQVCAAIDVDLVNDKTKEVGFKFLYMLRIDLAIEPADVCDFVKLLLTDKPIIEKMQGMVQVNHLFSLIPGRFGSFPLTPMRDSMWRSARTKMDSEPTLRDCPLGLMEFVNNDSEFSVTIPLPVFSISMKQARERNPFVMVSWITGDMSEKPMTVETCMEYINVHIRSDEENQLKLRTEMTAADKAIVRSARSKQSATRDSAVLLRKKIARESIYANISLPD